MTTQPTLFVGVGSHHGDDRIGLCVAEELQRCHIPNVEVRSATTPSELLDWLDGVERLVVCDACRTSAEIGTLYQWAWPATQINTTRFIGSHDLSLPAVLTLADRLGQLPSDVVVVGIAIGGASPGELLTLELVASIPRLVEHIRGVLERA